MQAWGIGGRWQSIKSEHKQIQMVSERVRIVQLSEGQFQTTADFIFRNHGPATTVTMGFPEGHGVDFKPTRSSLEHFATWVDGRRVPAHWHPIVTRKDNFTALWVKIVPFGRDVTRRVRVRYISECIGGESDGYTWVSYTFTGGNWRGKVRESVLDLRFLPGWYRFDTINLQNNQSVSRQGAHFRFRWTNWQAQTDFQLGYNTVFPNELTATSGVQSKGGGSSFLAIEPGLWPRNKDVSYSTDCGDSILWKGHLWIRAQKFAQCEWSEKRQGMILRLGKKACFISARGASRRSRSWPVNAKQPFWAGRGSEDRGFFVPARLLLQKFGGKFDTDEYEATYRNGKVRKRL